VKTNRIGRDLNFHSIATANVQHKIEIFADKRIRVTEGIDGRVAGIFMAFERLAEFGQQMFDLLARHFLAPVFFVFLQPCVRATKALGIAKLHRLEFQLRRKLQAWQFEGRELPNGEVRHR
jgi:hypothetical protein